MNGPEIINFVNGRQYKSISNIQKLNKNSIMKDLEYDYVLNLQTKAKLSTTVNIYISAQELRNLFIDTLKELLEKKNSLNNESTTVSIKNYIPGKVFSYYGLDLLLPESYSRDAAKSIGCVEYLDLCFTLEDHRFIKIDGKVAYRIHIFKHRPKCIQPKTIILSLDEVEELILLLEGCLIYD